jgi:hypothetical protein
MEQAGEWDESAFRQRCPTWQLTRWIAYWKYKNALQDQALQKARMEAGGA